MDSVPPCIAVTVPDGFVTPVTDAGLTWDCCDEQPAAASLMLHTIIRTTHVIKAPGSMVVLCLTRIEEGSWLVMYDPLQTCVITTARMDGK